MPEPTDKVLELVKEAYVKYLKAEAETDSAIFGGSIVSVDWSGQNPITMIEGLSTAQDLLKYIYYSLHINNFSTLEELYTVMANVIESQIPKE